MENILRHIFILWLLFKSTSSQISTFSNPILDVATENALLLKTEASYYLVYGDNPAIELKILKSPFLTDFRNADKGFVYRPPSTYTSIRPSSILEYQNVLYMYFHMKTDTINWRTFVLKAEDPKNPMRAWSAPVRVLDHIWNNTAAHGTPLLINGQLYIVWSGPSVLNPKWGLHIAKMRNPTEVLEPVILLREPVEDLECGLERPSFLYNRDKIYFVFTSCTPNTTTGTSLSYISIQLGMDPMNPANWQSNPDSIFEGNQEENVFQIRNSEFTSSPDGTETWMMYIASSNISDINPNFRVKVDKMDWNKTTGSPIFPVARKNDYPQQLPSGEPSKFFNPVNGELAHSYPNAYRDDDTYYTVSRTNQDKELLLLKSNKLYDYSDAERSVVYTASEGFIVGAGRIFKVDEEVYLYFALGSEVYVLKAENASDLMQNWGTPTKLIDGYHPTILQLNNQNYFVWSNTYAETGSSVTYIAPMLSPTEIMEPIVLLKEPRQSWECHGGCVNDYASFVYRKNVAYMIFAASSVADNSSLSYISIENGKDPLDVANWYTAPGPVFTENVAENVYATGRAWLTTSPDGLEDWIMYMASENGTTPRIRIQKISWDDESGHPIFPTALGFSHPLAIPGSPEYFKNPITDDSTVSPDVIRVGDFYYMLLSSTGDTDIELLKSGKLENFRDAERHIVYSVPDGYSIFGSSKMHRINDQLYIYFSMEGQNDTARMYVIQAQDPINPMGIWNTNAIALAPSWEFPSFQSTVLQHGGIMYLVWISPHPATGFNSIFIAEMKNATYVVEPFNLIRHPTELWECDAGCSNEAPYFIYNEGTAYLVHSVGSACNGGNALTYMSIEKDKDPMNVVNWNKAPGKVFSENQDDSVFCPSHASFTFSPDGKENWMVYHATDSPHPDAVKTARIERISWHLETGEPIFTEPHGLYQQQLVPSRKKFWD